MKRKERKRLQQIREEGIEPFKLDFDTDARVRDIVESYKEKKKGESVEEVKIAGRIVELRALDEQILLKLRGEEDQIEASTEEQRLIAFIEKYVQEGDIVGLKGRVSGKKDEASLIIDDLEILSKALRPLSGVNSEQGNREDRSLHFINKLEVRESLRLRSKTIKAFREYLEKRGFLEVETPLIKTEYDGTNEEPFRTYIEGKNEEGFLRIAKELHLKRMIIGGFEKIFEIGKDFRNEVIDETHNPEFTELELYQAYTDYEDMMDLTEEMIEQVVREVKGSLEIEYQGQKIDFSTPWTRMTMVEAIEEYGGFDVEALSDQEIKEKLKAHDIEIDSDYQRGLAIFRLFEETAEENLIQPVHIIDFPKETTPLCRDHREKEGKIERFETFVAGIEIANSYTELRDPIKLEEKYEQEERRQRQSEGEEYPLDKEFIEAMKLGMPPTGGLGIGIDRLVMLLTDSGSIREILAFPMTK